MQCGAALHPNKHTKYENLQIPEAHRKPTLFTRKMQACDSEDRVRAQHGRKCKATLVLAALSASMEANAKTTARVTAATTTTAVEATAVSTAKAQMCEGRVFE